MTRLDAGESWVEGLPPQVLTAVNVLSTRQQLTSP
jgi:hypothetical protein